MKVIRCRDEGMNGEFGSFRSMYLDLGKNFKKGS